MAEVDSPQNTSSRIPQLDGLRGIAIAMVLVYHYAGNTVGIQPHFPLPLALLVDFGWSGVDLFFVLSGFLIGGILLDARQSTNFFRVFYRRRICRIFPIYFAYLAVFFFGSHFMQTPVLHNIFHPEIPWQACVTFTQNFWIAFHKDTGAFALAPTWSLAVEEQFYLTIPALVYFVKPQRLGWILIGGIVLAPLIRLATFLVNPRLTYAIVFLLPCRMDSILMGVALAYFLRLPGAWEFLRAHRRQVWTAVEVLTCLCALLTLYPTNFSPQVMLVGFDLLGLLFSTILVLCLMEERVARCLRIKWLMILGTVSYCVYLIHELVLGMTYLVLSRYTTSWAMTAILALILTIVISKCSWEYFEKPFVRLGHREHYQPASVPSGKGSAQSGTRIGVSADS